MPKRKRRNMSASPIGGSDSRTYHVDTDVLKTVDPAQHPDDWPIFVLDDATVFTKDGAGLENAFSVRTKGPLRARGRLMIEERSQQRQLTTKYRAVPSPIDLEVRNSSMYSIGLAEHGRAVIWVSSPCGWLEISPSKAYEEVYTQMCHTVALYYAAVDAYLPYYDGSEIRSMKPSLDELLLKYAVSVGDGSLKEDVLHRCRLLAPYILEHIGRTRVENESEGMIQWEELEFFQLLQKSVKETPPTHQGMFIQHAVRNLSVKEAPPPLPAEALLSPKPRPPGRPRGRKPRVEPPAEEEVTESPRESERPARRSHSASETQGPREVAEALPRSHSDHETAVQTLVNELNEIFDSGQLKAATRGGVCLQIYLRNKINPYHAAHELVLLYAQDILPLLDPKRWEGTEFVTWLRGNVNAPCQPVHISANRLPFVLERRAKATNRTAKPNQAEGTPDRGQGAGKRTRYQRVSGLRPPTASKKRTLGDVDDDSTEEGVRSSKMTKKSHYFEPEDDDSEENAEEEADVSESTESDEDAGQVLGRDAVRVAIRSENLPTMKPKSKNGTWVCEEAGCDYIVRRGDEPEGREQIRLHFRDHEREMETINLAKTESRGYLPINHLLDKIKEAGQRAQRKERKSLGGRTPPPPIQGRLLA